MGYVYQILMGRLLSPIEFGLLSALFALYSILIAPLGTLLMLISRKVAEYGAVGKEHQVLDLYADMLRRCTYTAAAFVLLWLIVSPVTQVYLQTDKAQHVYLLGLLIVVTMPMVVTMGIAQGLQKFITFGLSQLLLILVKILLAIALVLIGLAVSGVVIGSIISALLVFVFLHRVLRLRFARSERAHLSLRSSVPVFVANSALTGMTYVDILLVNYYFDPREVGVYAVAAVLGKAIIHLPAGIVQALLPIASESYARNEKGNALLWQGLGLTLVLTLGGALFYLLFGEWFVSLLFGHEYINAGVILSFY
jgi:O-antigen/teichoic acid export membrane protein